MATGYVHMQLETGVGNEGTATAASTKILYPPLIHFGHALKANPMERDDENRNVDEPFAVLPEIYDPSWDFEERAYPDTMGMFLALMLGPPTTMQGVNAGTVVDLNNGTVPGGVYRHVWTAPFLPTGVRPQTAQFQAAYKDQSVFFKLRGAACSALSIDSPTSGGARVKASGLGTYLSRIADPGLTPAYEALTIRPFTRSGLTLPTWLSNTSTHEDFNIAIANSHETVRTLGIASRFPDDVEKGDAPVIFTGSVPKRLIGTADWDSLLANTGFAALAQWSSDTFVGTTTFPYKMIVSMGNCQYVDGGANPLENKRRIGASYNFKATNATGTAGSTIVQIMNATSSYA